MPKLEIGLLILFGAFLVWISAQMAYADVSMVWVVSADIVGVVSFFFGVIAWVWGIEKPKQ